MYLGDCCAFNSLTLTKVKQLVKDMDGEGKTMGRHLECEFEEDWGPWEAKGRPWEGEGIAIGMLGSRKGPWEGEGN